MLRLFMNQYFCHSHPLSPLQLLLLLSHLPLVFVISSSVVIVTQILCDAKSF